MDVTRSYQVQDCQERIEYRKCAIALMEPRKYKISRQGQILASVDLNELASKWFTKEFTSKDYYWTEGMVEWKPLSNLASKLEEELEHQRRQQREELARAKETEMAEAAKARPHPTLLSGAQATPLRNPAPAPKGWVCGVCNAVTYKPKQIDDGGKDSTAGALLFFLGIFLCLCAFGSMFGSNMDNMNRFVMLLLLVGGAFFCFSFGLARIITGGTSRALIRVLGNQQCPSCGSLRLRPH
jgi:hypothetical protein